jgi:energy-coupling factor transport system ATP-binding protein
MITIKNLNYKYKTGDFALSNINLEIKDNEFVSIIGKNGSGKSTFSKLISGLVKFKTGEIKINDLDLSNKKQALEIRKNVAIVFQNPENQIIFDKVYDDIAFGLKNLGFSKEEIDLRIDEALKQVNMYEFKNAYTTELSLGQKQRIAIASSIAIKPKVLILDEPTTMLDPTSKKQIYEILKDLKKHGIIIIYITNFIDEILLADRTVIFENGKIKNDFYKKDLLQNLGLLKDFEFPGIISLLAELKANGIDINLDNLSIQELAQKLLSKELNK